MYRNATILKFLAKITHITLTNRCKKIPWTGLCRQEVRHNTFFRHCSCWSNTNSLLCRIWEAEKPLAFWLEEARQPYFLPLQISYSQNQRLYPPRKYDVSSFWALKVWVWLCQLLAITKICMYIIQNHLLQRMCYPVQLLVWYQVQFQRVDLKWWLNFQNSWVSH